MIWLCDFFQRLEFFLFELRDFCFRFRVRAGDGLTGQFQSFFFWTGHFQLFFFFNISRTNSKTVKVNQQSVLNHHFPNNLDRTITFNSVTLKNKQSLKKSFFFSQNK